MGATACRAVEQCAHGVPTVTEGNEGRFRFSEVQRGAGDKKKEK